MGILRERPMHDISTEGEGVGCLVMMICKGERECKKMSVFKVWKRDSVVIVNVPQKVAT
jgi:hypothetical protein